MKYEESSLTLVKAVQRREDEESAEIMCARVLLVFCRLLYSSCLTRGLGFTPQSGNQMSA